MLTLILSFQMDSLVSIGMGRVVQKCVIGWFPEEVRPYLTLHICSKYVQSFQAYSEICLVIFT